MPSTLLSLPCGLSAHTTVMRVFVVCRAPRLSSGGVPSAVSYKKCGERAVGGVVGSFLPSHSPSTHGVFLHASLQKRRRSVSPFLALGSRRKVGISVAQRHKNTCSPARPPCKMQWFCRSGATFCTCASHTSAPRLVRCCCLSRDRGPTRSRPAGRGACGGRPHRVAPRVRRAFEPPPSRTTVPPVTLATLPTTFPSFPLCV